MSTSPYLDQLSNIAPEEMIMSNLQNTYVLGHADQELDRLTIQARILEPSTRQLLQEAGIRPGMRVLDIGCGSGDVSFLAASLVGPAGRVVGVDLAAAAVRRATARARSANLNNVSFVEGDPSDMEFTNRFDAIVGRLVMMYLPNPVEALQKLVRHLHPGGVIVIQEIDMASSRSMPPSPLFEQCLRWVSQTLHKTGARIRMGLELHSVFVKAGLPAPFLRLDAAIGGGDDNPVFTAVAEAVRSLLPAMEKLKVATAWEVGAEDLEHRLRQEIGGNGGTVAYPSMIGAWARIAA
jgi:ubiquinone/menaquinone biosynthesis C-methylase UbiE